jgi:putative sterol carrier protein
MPYQFLSDEWIEAAHQLREEFPDAAPVVGVPVRINLVVTEIPFGEGDIQAHLDNSAGDLRLDKGHLAEADLTVTVDYLTAKAILVDGNPQAAMQAFMTGKIRVDGDISKLMELQASSAGGSSHELAERLRSITQD